MDEKIETDKATRQWHPRTVSNSMIVGMEKFILTFGSQYSYQIHPKFDFVDPYGYVELFAEDYAGARELAYHFFGTSFSMLYSAEEFFNESIDHLEQWYGKGDLAQIATYPLVKSLAEQGVEGVDSLPLAVKVEAYDRHRTETRLEDLRTKK